MADLTCHPSVALQGQQVTDRCSQPFCLSTGQIVGLSFTAQAGFISAAAVLVLLAIVAVKYGQNIRDPINPSWRLIKTNIDGFMLNLLIADLFMSLGAILDVKWASERKTYCGTYCNAQGAIQILGETAVALLTLAITSLSFISVFRGRAIKHSVFLWGGVSGAIWLFVVLWAVLGHAAHTEDFYTPTPYWCWIGAKYRAQRLGAEYVWLWIAGFGSIFLYIPLFFVLRRNITWDAELGWRSIQWRWRPGSSRRSETSFVDPKDARDMESTLSSRKGGTSPATFLWYPLAYTIVVLPVSIVRWITFDDQNDPTPTVATATFVSVSIFNLSGLVNVILILFTRTNVLLLGSHSTDGQRHADSTAHLGRRPRANGAGSRVARRRSSQHVGERPTADPGPEDAPTDQAKGETGFGGPRVTLRDDDSEFRDARMDRGRGAHRAGPGFAASPSYAVESSAVPAQMQTGDASGDGPEAPGRAYLKSLGHVRRA